MPQDNPTGRSAKSLHNIKPRDLLRERLQRKKSAVPPAKVSPDDPNQAYAARMTTEGLGDDGAAQTPAQQPRTRAAHPESLSRVAELAARGLAKEARQAQSQPPTFDHRDQDVLPSVEPLASPPRRPLSERLAESRVATRPEQPRDLPVSPSSPSDPQQELRKTAQIPPRRLPEPLRRPSAAEEPTRERAKLKSSLVQPEESPDDGPSAFRKKYPSTRSHIGEQPAPQAKQAQPSRLGRLQDAGARVKAYVADTVLPPGEELSTRNLVQAISAKSVPILERMGAAELGGRPSSGASRRASEQRDLDRNQTLSDSIPAPPTSLPPVEDSDPRPRSGKPRPRSHVVDALAATKERRPPESPERRDDDLAETDLRTAAENATRPTPLQAASRLPLTWIAWGVGFIAAAWLAGSTGLSGVSTALGDLAQALEPSAAFQVVENFEEGVSESWLGSSPRGSEEGLPLVAGFGLHADTLNFVNYRFEFETKILRQGVGWIVRAADEGNYYGFRLVEKGPESHVLERFIVVDGEKVPLWDGQVELAGLRKTGYRRVSARVMGDSVSTFVDGLRVDYFRDTRHMRGGAGFLANGGDQAQLRYFSVSGNQDSWGLFLYGTVQTLRSAQSLFGPAPLNAEASAEETPSLTGQSDRQAAM